MESEQISSSEDEQPKRSIKSKSSNESASNRERKAAGGRISDLGKKVPTSKMSDVKPQIEREVKRLVASAVLTKDGSFTKKMCREQLYAVFGSEQVDRHIEFFREEFDKVKKHCFNAGKEDLQSMVAMNTEDREDAKISAEADESSSDLDAPLQSSVQKPLQKRSRSNPNSADGSKNKHVKDIKSKKKEQTVHARDISSKKKVKPASLNTKDIKLQIEREVKRLVASAALTKDGSFTKKMCREQLYAVFGSEQVDRHIEFFREEFDKVSKHCLNSGKEDLQSMVAMNTEDREDAKISAEADESSSDLDAPLGSKANSHQPGKKRVREGTKLPKEKKIKEANLRRPSMEEGALQKDRMETYTLLLERIIAKASIDDDKSLTKKTCREKLKDALGLTTLDHDLEFINAEIGRITALCLTEDADAVRVMAEQAIPPNVKDFFQPISYDRREAESEGQMSDDSQSSHNSDGSVSSSSLDFTASKKLKSRRVTGIFSGIVVVPCGKEFGKNESALQRFKDLIESNGGKLQSCVTRKVHYVVVANGGYLKNKDTRVMSARKHGAKLVMESFFEECIRQQSIVDFSDHIAVHSDSRPSTSKTPKGKASKDKNQDAALHADDSGGNESDAMETMDGDESFSPSVHKSKRVMVRKSKEENEWSKDVRARFSYVKDARSRVYNPKDPVVSGATFVTEKGVLYNAYLTHTDFDNGEDGQTKFFAIKLVEAGGLMKGERWHVVTQWGKVGATKPGCDVADFDDYESAVQIFKQRFWDKTRNAWDSSAFAFRTVSGKYTMEQLSEDEDQVDSSADEDEVPSRLDIRVQSLIALLFSSKTIDRILKSLGMDTDKLNFRRLKGSIIRESYAELVSIQKIMQRGEAAKHSEKEIQRIRGHSDRLSLLLQLNTGDVETPLINTVAAVQEKMRIIDELHSVSVLVSTKKRCLSSLSSTCSRLDVFYSGLRCHIDPISASGDQFHFISKMLQDSASADSLRIFTPRLLNLFSVTRAGEDGRYAAFSALDNKMLLWHAVRATGLSSVLLQGMCTAAPEAPAIGYPLGKGLYFYDSSAVALSASGFCEDSPAEFLILCEVALGTTHESIRPSYIQRAPHGYHSVMAKGISTYDPCHRVPFFGEQGLQAVIGAPQKSFGNKDSTFKFNQYVVYDVGQVCPTIPTLMALLVHVF